MGGKSSSCVLTPCRPPGQHSTAPRSPLSLWFLHGKRQPGGGAGGTSSPHPSTAGHVMETPTPLPSHGDRRGICEANRGNLTEKRGGTGNTQHLDLDPPSSYLQHLKSGPKQRLCSWAELGRSEPEPGRRAARPSLRPWS